MSMLIYLSMVTGTSRILPPIVQSEQNENWASHFDAVRKDGKNSVPKGHWKSVSS